MQIKTVFLALSTAFLPLLFSYADENAPTAQSLTTTVVAAPNTMASITTIKTTLNIEGAVPGQSLFAGTATACFKSTGPNSPDCCSKTGWGTDPSLNTCPDAAKALAIARNAGLAVQVGDSCVKNPDGSCATAITVYCVYSDKTAYTIETTGRVGQLGLGYGTPDNPDCSGLSVAQIQKLDLTELNFMPASGS